MMPADAKADDALWAEIAPIFSGRAFMRAHSSWLAGLASRSGHDRMARLTGSKAAQRLRPLIEGIDRRQLARLIVRSAINQDQALSALRLTLVANISGPVGALVLINQFLPGSVGDFLRSLPPVAVFVPLFVAVAMLLSVLWFAYAGVTAARDLNHLLRLQLAEVAGATGAEDDEDDDVLSRITDLA